jgi:CRP-like cAMP-binding protein
MPDVIEFCNRLSPLTEEASKELTQILNTKTYQKGDYLLKSGQICKHLYYIDQGLTKTFFYKEDKEFIMRFFHENLMFTVLDSYVTQTPTHYMILALEPTAITSISYDNMEALCKKHHCIEIFMRKLVSIASINMMSRISEMLEENATNRYNNFVEKNNSLLQRISLGDLASYIGITQVSLSRIRTKR